MAKIISLLLVVFALGQAAAAQAGTGEPNEPAAKFVKTVSADVLALLTGSETASSGQESDLKGLLETSLDLKSVGRVVLDEHWQMATAAQRDEYLALFSDYVLAILIRVLRADPIRDISIVAWSAPSGEDATVRTLVARGKADSLDWTWKVRKTGQGYRAVDLISSGISMARTLKSEFGTFLEVNGFEDLLRVLRTKPS